MNLENKKFSAASKVSDLRSEVNSFIIDNLNRIGINNISVSHGNILFMLIKYKSLTMKELAGKINRDASTVTSLVKKLEKNEYVVITENAKDTRSKIVSLSSKSKSIKEDFFNISENLNESLWDGINEEDAYVFMECLDKMIENIKKSSKK